MMILSVQAVAQITPVIEHPDIPKIEPLKLSGPRVGITYLSSISAQTHTRIQEAFGWEEGEKLSPFITQFGWQFEWRYFETPGGDAGVLEVIPMVGGFEQSLFLPSLNTLVGYRSKSGFEVGFGPNINLVQSGFVFAVGYNIQNGYMNFPLNLAFIPGKEGARIAITVGFNSRS